MPALNANGYIYTPPPKPKPAPPAPTRVVRPEVGVIPQGPVAASPPPAAILQAYQQLNDSGALAPSPGLLGGVANAMFAPQQLMLSPLMDKRGKPTRAARWLESYSRGAGNTFNPQSYLEIPGALAYAKDNPGEAVRQMLHGMTTPEGLGEMTTGALLGGGVAGAVKRAPSPPKTPAAGPNLLKQAVMEERGVTEQMKMLAAANAQRARRVGDKDQTIRNATRRLGFFRPDDPRAMGPLYEGLNIPGGHRIGDQAARSAYRNPEGFFAENFSPGTYNFDLYEGMLADKEFARYMQGGADNARFSQMDAPLDNANRFFGKAFGSPVVENASEMFRFLPDELRHVVASGGDPDFARTMRVGQNVLWTKPDSPAVHPELVFSRAAKDILRDMVTRKRGPFYPGRR